MIPQKFSNLLIPVLLVLLLTSCEKNPFAPGTELPKETTIGANTFGCLVNGKVWRNGGIYFPNSSLTVDLNYSNLLIKATRQVKDTLSGISVSIFKPAIGLGEFTCDSLSINILYTLIIGGSVYDYPRTHEGKIEITRYDLVNRIVSGRFEAKFQLEGYEEIVITKGRFDLKTY